MSENWRGIPGYEGLYEVSDLGRIKSLGNDKNRKEKILSPGKTRNGYLRLVLCKDGKHKTFLVHRLVWLAFNGSIPEGYDCNHINEIKTDCRLENINLMTRKANINWGSHNRRSARARSKMVEQYTLDGTHICTWFSSVNIRREFGYSTGSISDCCNGRQKTAYGYIWKYAE